MQGLTTAYKAGGGAGYGVAGPLVSPGILFVCGKGGKANDESHGGDGGGTGNATEKVETARIEVAGVEIDARYAKMIPETRKNLLSYPVSPRER